MYHLFYWQKSSCTVRSVQVNGHDSTEPDRGTDLPHQGGIGLGDVSHNGEGSGTMLTLGSLYTKEKESQEREGQS